MHEASKARKRGARRHGGSVIVLFVPAPSRVDAMNNLTWQEVLLESVFKFGCIEPARSRSKLAESALEIDLALSSVERRCLTAPPHRRGRIFIRSSFTPPV